MINTQADLDRIKMTNDLQKSEPKIVQWDNPIEFLMTCIG